MTDQVREGVVLFGCPRSGTTLLRRLLDAHPSFAAPGETYALTSAARFLEGERMVDGLEVGVVNGLGFLGFSSDEVVGRLRDLVFSFRREHAASEGKPRWVEKTAVDAFHLATIHRLCADRVQYVCIVRHGLDVVCSMQDWIGKSQAYPSELHRYIRENPRPLHAFARAWVDATNAILDFAESNPEDACLLQYENLVADPNSNLAALFEFLGEDYVAASLSTALTGKDSKGFSDWKSFARSAIEDASVGRWKTVLSRETVMELSEIVNPTLRRIGYEPVVGGGTQDEAQKRRRYEIGLALQKLK
ncbi:sulfotransferase [Defluviimonas sp. WL0050]|uniref:Sulfotransferase n=1 Tax=Albidovulum litorale TaxID=2984134 RepID=A0ABT2ZTN5_9RHOB|nr:sulfotransferase [Defluviimonas sp. WL0050]MCV2874520.1 sulfotransferase [Defluviimonas sp. WL0050]